VTPPLRPALVALVVQVVWRQMMAVLATLVVRSRLPI
jgi:hypothetical protein